MERKTLWYSVDLVRKRVDKDGDESYDFYDELAKFSADEFDKAKEFYESVNMDEMQSRLREGSIAVVDLTECFERGAYTDEETWDTKEYRAQ